MSKPIGTPTQAIWQIVLEEVKPIGTPTQAIWQIVLEEVKPIGTPTQAIWQIVTIGRNVGIVPRRPLQSWQAPSVRPWEGPGLGSARLFSGMPALHCGPHRQASRHRDRPAPFTPPQPRPACKARRRIPDAFPTPQIRGCLPMAAPDMPAAPAAAADAADGAPPLPPAIADDRLRAAIVALVPNADDDETRGEFRRRLAVHLGLPDTGLDHQKDRVRQLLEEYSNARAGPVTPAVHMGDLVASLGQEDPNKKARVYLATISRLLPDTLAEVDSLVDTATLTRQVVGEAVKNAFDNPLPRSDGKGAPVNRAGDQGMVKKLAVFKEFHTDGTPHFHVAVALLQTRAWGPAKRSLRERHSIASHWSTTHTQFWSALRYGVIPTVKKPVVDKTPWTWTKDPGALLGWD